MATCTAQIGRWRPTLDALARVGPTGDGAELSGDEIRARTGCPLALAGHALSRWRHGAAGAATRAACAPPRSRPGCASSSTRRCWRFVASGRRWSRRRAARSRPTRWCSPRTPGSRACATCDATIVPVASYIVLTEPAPDRIARIGWTGGEALGDERLLVHYTHVTHDGRIAFGRGGGAIGPARARVRGRWSTIADVVETVARDFRRFFPELADLQADPRLGRADRSRAGPPAVRRQPRRRRARALLRRVLRERRRAHPSRRPGARVADARRARRADATTGIADGPPGYLPPEPLRSIGGVLVRNAVRRAEAAEERERTPDPSRALGRTARVGYHSSRARTAALASSLG